MMTLPTPSATIAALSKLPYTRCAVISTSPLNLFFTNRDNRAGWNKVEIGNYRASKTQRAAGAWSSTCP
jgi:hypothetical protein